MTLRHEPMRSNATTKHLRLYTWENAEDTKCKPNKTHASLCNFIAIHLASVHRYCFKYIVKICACKVMVHREWFALNLHCWSFGLFTYLPPFVIMYAYIWVSCIHCKRQLRIHLSLLKSVKSFKVFGFQVVCRKENGVNIRCFYQKKKMLSKEHGSVSWQIPDIKPMPKPFHYLVCHWNFVIVILSKVLLFYSTLNI